MLSVVIYMLIFVSKFKCNGFSSQLKVIFHKVALILHKVP